MTLDLPAALGVFSLSAVVIVVAAIALARSGDVIAARTGMGRLWVGSLLVAGATSLPELVTNVAAVRIGAPALAAGNVFGANMLNMSNLAGLAALLGGRSLFQQVASQQRLVAAFALTLTSVATLLVVLQPDGKWLGVSVGTVVLLAGYLIGMRLLHRASTGIQEGDGPETSHSLRWGWTVFLLSAVAIFATGPFLASSAQQIAHITGIGESFIGVLAVALVTTLPELTAAAAALRMGAPDMAVGAIYGTNAFNIAVLGVADLFFPHSSLFSSLDQSHIAAGLFAVLLTILGLSQLLLRRPVRHLSFTEPSTLGIVFTYVLGLFVVFQLS